jgi:hypothetical protein
MSNNDANLVSELISNYVDADTRTKVLNLFKNNAATISSLEALKSQQEEKIQKLSDEVSRLRDVEKQLLRAENNYKELSKKFVDNTQKSEVHLEDGQFEVEELLNRQNENKDYAIDALSEANAKLIGDKIALMRAMKLLLANEG